MDGVASLEPDIWSQWLDHYRYGFDTDAQDRVLTQVGHYVERVLNGARLKSGMVMLDIGCGDGAMSFRAIAQTGPGLQVVLLDISKFLLQRAEYTARNLGLCPQCRFVQDDAETLSQIADHSVDVVTSRSSLAYVQHKSASFQNCYRVLKPGGRLSIMEPIFYDEALAVAAMKMILQARPPDHPDQFLPLWHRIKATQYPDNESAIRQFALTNFTERDLVRFAQQAGFVDIQMAFHIEVKPEPPTTLEAFLATAPHPLAPSPKEFMAANFSPAERDYICQNLRHMVEQPVRTSIDRVAYLTASKPPADILF
ncbi:MAG: hypothetical protein B7Z75_01905 [Acidocella sp. 20-57-95]|nr:MAG: hypothetical protein B7Z75_01905 [Acidocella sp. 20-57-95]OYV62207.1 MAG: hypothetical protein B7Z71_02080 [Acidocella sp. 21-58-7]HQT63755.1 class I SAM-dependent methyltransferase [Acidocella sp.]HQU03131.1 class I SAM-dependent methyltransferase [Acidocella sp.]